jgi:hypothetical protein
MMGVVSLDGGARCPAAAMRFLRRGWSWRAPGRFVSLLGLLSGSKAGVPEGAAASAMARSEVASCLRARVRWEARSRRGMAPVVCPDDESGLGLAGARGPLSRGSARLPSAVTRLHWRCPWMARCCGWLGTDCPGRRPP